jgi:hypothetical protein
LRKNIADLFPFQFYRRPFSGSPARYNLKASPSRAGMAMAYKPSRALVLEGLYGFWRRGLPTLSNGMMVSPEPGAIELLRRYNVALNYAVNKILRLNLKNRRDSQRSI